MNTSFDFGPQDGNRIVYVRPVPVTDLPEEIRGQAMGAETVYGLHDSDGQRLALVRDRRMAFLLAREHAFAAVDAH